jgi:ABC-2 type transport system ATP-binding protein
VADVFNISAAERDERIRKYADLFEITSDLGDLISAYSHGMKQKLAIISALIHNPKLLVLDEPFKGLDEALRERVLALLNGSLKQTAVLLATHSEEEAAALGCRILRCRDGTFA